jgi:hypothetical protein
MPFYSQPAPVLFRVPRRRSFPSKIHRDHTRCFENGYGTATRVLDRYLDVKEASGSKDNDAIQMFR